MTTYTAHRPLTPAQRAHVQRLYWHYGLGIADIIRRTGYRFRDVKAAVAEVARAGRAETRAR